MVSIYNSTPPSTLNPLAKYLFTPPIKSPTELFEFEFYMPGGDYCEEIIPNFDRKKGNQHNFKTVVQIFEELTRSSIFKTDWKSYWAKTFLLDALIGNTDRHQDNWGIILTASIDPGNKKTIIEKRRASPVFDNGTSMAHEIFPNKFKGFDFKKYILKGHHHMRWNINDPNQMQHAEMLKKLADQYPETHAIMVDCLKKVNPQSFKTILDGLVAFEIPVNLTVERANFMLELLQERHQYLLDELGN